MLLRGENLTKHFGGLAALRGVSIEIDAGEIVGLIGPNGAGKTTLFNVVAGLYRPDHGRVLFGSQDITAKRPHEIAKLGIARTFQIPKPFPTMTVRENVLVAAVFGENPEVGVSKAQKRADEVLEFVNLTSKRDALARNLTVADKKALEMARALATSPKLLLLDEVVSGLTPIETQQAIELIRRARDDLRVTVLWIEHVMKAVMSLCGRVVVLHHGEKIAEGPPEAISRDERVIEAYLGAEEQV